MSIVNEGVNNSSKTRSVVRHNLHPAALIRNIVKRIPRNLPYYGNTRVRIDKIDPITNELLKLRPHGSLLKITKVVEDHVSLYSAKLQELLYLVLDEPNLDDNARIKIEQSLSDLLSYLPRVSNKDYNEFKNDNNGNIKNNNTNTNTDNKNNNRDNKNSNSKDNKNNSLDNQSNKRKSSDDSNAEESVNCRLKHNIPYPEKQELFPTYPADYLSKILLDNYFALTRVSTSYFNLSLSSVVTKYIVELIYQLNYWEVVHLAHMIPEIQDFLQLIGFEVVSTSFGPIVRPPENYLEDKMLQGLQYPFPYPFYNYSYHSFDPDVGKRKMELVRITPYIDITLKNTDLPPVKKKRGRKSKKALEREAKELATRQREAKELAMRQREAKELALRQAHVRKLLETHNRKKEEQKDQEDQKKEEKAKKSWKRKEWFRKTGRIFAKL